MNATANPTLGRRPAWLIVAKREIMAQLESKAFWVGTLSTMLLVGLSFLIASVLGGSGSTTTIAVSSDYAAAVVAIANEQGQNLEALRVDESALAAAVRAGDASAALQFSPASGWEVSVDDPMRAPDLAQAVSAFQLEKNAVALGVDPAGLLADTTVKLVPLDGDSPEGMAIYFATFAFSILFMLAAMTYGMQIATSVVTEKESRIVEILAAAVPLRSLLVGKVVGNTIMALVQVVLIVATTLVGLSFSPYAELIALVAPVVGWFILFFLVGFASLACLWAAAGAMATRVQDLTQTTTPLTMIVMAVYMAGIFASGTVAKVLSFLPIASTVMMPGRLLSGEAGWLEALLALLASLAFMAVAIWAGVSIYRRGLLQTGSVLSVKDLFRRAA